MKRKNMTKAQRREQLSALSHLTAKEAARIAGVRVGYARSLRVTFARPPGVIDELRKLTDLSAKEAAAKAGVAYAYALTLAKKHGLKFRRARRKTPRRTDASLKIASVLLASLDSSDARVAELLGVTREYVGQTRARMIEYGMFNL